MADLAVWEELGHLHRPVAGAITTVQYVRWVS